MYFKQTKMKKSIILSFVLIMMSFSLIAQTHDIIIKGGHLIDPLNNIDQIMDVAIKGNKISAVEKSIPKGLAKKVVDASGLIVSPGLIDMHTHNFYGTVPNRYLANSFSAVPPDGFTFRRTYAQCCHSVSSHHHSVNCVLDCPFFGHRPGDPISEWLRLEGPITPQTPAEPVANCVLACPI